MKNVYRSFAVCCVLFVLNGAAFFGLAGCKTSIPSPQPLQLSLYVRYFAEEGQQLAELRSRSVIAGKATGSKTLPGGARYQGKLMDMLTVSDTLYRFERAGSFEPVNQFEWTGADGTLLKTDLPVPSLDSFYFSPKPLSRKKAAVLTWVGAPLEKSETLILIWENKKTGDTRKVEVAGNPGDVSLTFPAAKMAELSAGEWSLYLVRKKTVQMNVQGDIVTAVAEYYTPSALFMIKD